MSFVHIEIRKVSEDRLFEQAWTFWFNDRLFKLVLDRYVHSNRPTTRHKFRVNRFYDRTDARANTIFRSEVPFPEAIQQEALNEFISNITVTKT